MRKIFLFVLLVTAPSRAAVVRVDDKEEPAGPYTRITGKVHFAVDPKLVANRIITDIDLGPRNEKGLVEFSADLLAKDVRLMLDSSDLPLPAAATVLESLQTAARHGRGDDDFSVIADREAW